MKKNLLSILALSFGISSFAQIVYTDITDVTLTPSTNRESLTIDLDNDGTVDYTIFALDTTIVEQGQNIPAVGTGLDIHGNNELDAGSQSIATGNIMAVTAYTNNQAINSSGSFMSGSGGSFLFPGGVLGMSANVPIIGLTNGGNFINTTDQYIAVKFEIGVSMPTTHYGWIRVDVADNSATITVKDFAYESTANDEIKAGENGISSNVSEKELANASVFFGNNELNINGITGNYNVSVVDLLGKSISNSTITNNASINLGNVNNGIYLVQITKGNSVVTKKVYIK